MEQQTKQEWSQTAQVMALSLTVVAGAAISFFVVMSRVDKVYAVVTFVRRNLAISLAGGCAFYVVIFILMKWAVESLMNPKN